MPVFAMGSFLAVGLGSVWALLKRVEMKTNWIRTDITDIVFVFIFVFEYRVGYEQCQFLSDKIVIDIDIIKI